MAWWHLVNGVRQLGAVSRRAAQPGWTTGESSGAKDFAMATDARPPAINRRPVADESEAMVAFDTITTPRGKHSSDN
jgi:hypothetical protein